jgi:alpha-tubulin suppressor-like RCC1 family protein
MVKNSVFRADQTIWRVILLLGAFLVLGGGPPAEAACGGASAITTDKPDYGPTETVVISGTGFTCGEPLSVLVTAPDGSTRSGDGTGAAGPDRVVTDDNGAFALDYHLSGTLTDGLTYQGQLGIYHVEVRDGSGTVLAETTFSDAGGIFSCALTTAGGVECWGAGYWGSLGDGSFATGSGTPVGVTGLSSGVVQITVGYGHACALTVAGAVKCWGANFFGALGNGSVANSATPVNVSGLTSGVAQISAGGYHTCAATTGGGAKCWGYNFEGQLGIGIFQTSPPYGSLTPVDVSGLTEGVMKISAGGVHTCAVTTGGDARCWGSNSDGQLGDGTFNSSATPIGLSGLTSSMAQISGGWYHTCAVTTGGAAKCWGHNRYGQLGDGTTTTSDPFGIPMPVDVIGLTSGVARISSGNSTAGHTCAVTIAGGAKCWGYNYDGRLGSGTFTPFPPTASPRLST